MSILDINNSITKNFSINSRSNLWSDTSPSLTCSCCCGCGSNLSNRWTTTLTLSTSRSTTASASPLSFPSIPFCRCKSSIRIYFHCKYSCCIITLNLSKRFWQTNLINPVINCWGNDHKSNPRYNSKWVDILYTRSKRLINHNLMGIVEHNCITLNIICRNFFILQRNISSEVLRSQFTSCHVHCTTIVRMCRITNSVGSEVIYKETILQSIQSRTIRNE